MSQLERRTTPQSWTWEIPAAALLSGGFALLLGAQLARALAVWTSGQGWAWPTVRKLVVSIPGVLAGDPSAGLQQALAPVPALGGWLVAVELGVLILLAWATAWLLRRYGPHRLRGVATPAQAEQLLGRSRLRRVRHIIRPDRYPPGSRLSARLASLVTRLIPKTRSAHQ